MTLDTSIPVAPTRDPRALSADLCAALLTPQGAKEMARLLTDLCTPAEISTMAERWHVARLLDGTNLSYREIHDATGVSTTTIVRVARFLRQEPHQGYRRALDTLGAESGGKRKKAC
jgi:TrpR-related protein YerC/YecD